MTRFLEEPAASRKTLVLVAGVVWLVVGMGLSITAAVWLSTFVAASLIPAAAGLMIGLLIARFGFSRIVKRNTDRIRALSPERPRICVFAFQAIQSYLSVFVMMAMGYALRHLPIPHVYLGAIYLAIGVALIKSGIDYVTASKTF